MASIGLFFFILGAGQWVNGSTWGAYSLAFGLVWWLVVLYQWFRDSVAESEGGLYGHKIDLSYRWSMSWFIFSEVMFFGAFFTALRVERMSPDAIGGQIVQTTFPRNQLPHQFLPRPGNQTRSSIAIIKGGRAGMGIYQPPR